MQPDTTPSPPAQTMLLATWRPHQSGLVQVAWSTTSRRACCRMSAMGPPAVWSKEGYKLKFSSGETLRTLMGTFMRLLNPSRRGRRRCTHCRDDPIQWRSMARCVGGGCQKLGDKQPWWRWRRWQGTAAWSGQCRYCRGSTHISIHHSSLKLSEIYTEVFSVCCTLSLIFHFTGWTGGSTSHAQWC